MSSFGSGFRKSARREADQHDFTQATLPGKQPVITSIIRDFSAEALSELRLWLEQNPPAIPIYQLPGFTQFAAKSAFVATTESTTSTTFTNLTTVGPQLTQLPDGKYLVIVSALMNVSPGGQSVAYMAPQINAAAAQEFDGALLDNNSTTGLPRVSAFGASVQTLNNGGNNTITAKYKSFLAAAPANFQYRNLIALRFANL